MKRILLAAIPLALFPLMSLGQTPIPTPPIDTDVVQITTNLVQIDAVVTGKNDRQVTDLSASDFEIFENGKKQKIVYFAFVAPSAPRSSGITSDAGKKSDEKRGVFVPTNQLSRSDVRRAYAIVIDDLGISFENVRKIKSALRNFIEEEVAPGDLVSIIATGKGSGALQSFTSDKRQLLAAVENIKWNAYGRGGISAFETLKPTLKEEVIVESESSGGSSERGDTDGAGLEEDVNFERAVTDFRNANFSYGTLGALNWIIRGMSRLPGRKSVILFSEGFSGFDSSGNPNVIFEQMRGLTAYANRESVTFYTVDPRGLQFAGAMADDDIREVVPTDPLKSKTPRLDDRSVSLRESQATLRYLAYETGGVPFVNNNDMSKGLERAMEDQKGYYLLAYEPDDETFDAEKVKYNEIEVKVLKEGLKVRTRNGFYSVPDEPETETLETPQQQIYGAVRSPFVAGDIPLTLNTFFSSDSDGKPYLRSLVYLRGEDLLFEKKSDGTRVANFDILAVTFTDKNEPASETSRNFTITVKEKDYAESQKTGFVYTLDLPLSESGPYQFRIALRDANSKKLGSASQFVLVPNLKKKEFALSGIVLDRYSAEEWQKLMSGSTSVTKRTKSNIDNALREFRSGDVLQFGYEVYNAKPDWKLEVRIRLIRDGQVVLEGSPRELDRSNASNPTRFESYGAITLGKNLDPGDYILQAIVTDKDKTKRSRTATQWVEFKVIR